MIELGASDSAATGPVALELNDSGLVACRSGATPASASPGYAVVDGDRLVAGEAARARARLTPRRTHHRFWHELDDSALPRPFPRRWSHADLAHFHLCALRDELALEPERVLAVVPSDWGASRLERFLGVAAAAGWPVAGLVDGAVAAAATFTGGAEIVWHLDIGLHRAVICELRRDAWVSRRRVLVVGEVGRVALERLWARFFARHMVRATRFDPLHSAASEQRLYDEMSGWLERLGEADGALVSLATGGREHQVEVSRHEVEAAAAEAYRAIVALVPSDFAPGPARLLLSHRAAQLPGLAAALAPVTGPPVALAAAAPLAGALGAADSILPTDGGDPLFVTRLPARGRGAA